MFLQDGREIYSGQLYKVISIVKVLPLIDDWREAYFGLIGSLEHVLPYQDGEISFCLSFLGLSHPIAYENIEKKAYFSENEIELVTDNIFNYEHYKQFEIINHIESV